MKVLKFGGTSIGTPQRMRDVAVLIRKELPCVVVLSAVSGTTNALVDVSDSLLKNKKENSIKILNNIETKYVKFICELFSTEACKRKGFELIKNISVRIKKFSSGKFSVKEEKIILAQGELISTGLFSLYLSEIGVSHVLLPALDFMKINKDEEPDTKFIEANLNKQLSENNKVNLFLTQGYICRNSSNEIDNLKRGGSDYSASLIGAAINCEEIQIWTDIDGIHNNDPRFVTNTKPIDELSFDEAAELAYFGAKILHPSSVLPAKEKNVPVRLLNTLKPQAKGTLIHERKIKSNGRHVKAVAAKDGIIAVKIISGRMLLAYGFLRRVFEIFELYKTPIDMITTSEVAVSLTIDDDRNLTGIIKELQKLGNVEVNKNQTIICLVGDFIAEKSGAALRIFNALKNIPLRMISYGGSENNITLLVDTKLKSDVLNSLNKIF
ncbi:MAG: aspartate kinase [Bacteroidales bacterium]|nr:aspartate kinase [Bacteroidales bacterium]